MIDAGTCRWLTHLDSFDRVSEGTVVLRHLGERERKVLEMVERAAPGEGALHALLLGGKGRRKGRDRGRREP